MNSCFKIDTNKILENNRIRLEPLKWEHFDNLLSISIKNPKLLRYSPSKFGTKKYFKGYFDNDMDLKGRELKFPYAIYDKQYNCYAGSTSFMNISQTDRRLEIGSTWIANKFQRTGLNRHGKFLLLKYVFEELLFERVEFKTDNRNKQSKLAIEQIGGKYEGVLRSHTIMPDGYRRDTVYFSILKSEWLNLKNKLFKEYNIC